MSNQKVKKLDVIPTLNFGEDWLSNEQIIADILEQNRDGGYTKFIIWYPNTGVISEEFPTAEEFAKGAENFKIIKDEVKKHGISLGWWLRCSINSGIGTEFDKIVRADGSSPLYTHCPLGKNLQKRLSEAIATFAKVGKPDFIFMEDDYSVVASAGLMGCFCDKHLKEFSHREGKKYIREELVAELQKNTPESLALLRRWRTLTTDSLVELATAIRTEVDKETPEINIGYMQAGSADCDGEESTYRISKAFAGENHTPFSRIMSGLYVFNSEKDLPVALFNSLYRIQSIKKAFKFLHETDPYPHTRFYTASGVMKACMGIVYSWGYDGSTYNNAQFCDGQNEERYLDNMYKSESVRFEEVHQKAKQCRIQGVGVEYDPFYNSLGGEISHIPLWVPTLAKFGVPITTAKSNIMFWDLAQARYKSDAEIKKALSGNLFLDGEAAKELCDRGYGEYLGIDIKESVCEDAYFKTGSPNAKPISFDIGAREVICEKFARKGKPRHMTTPFMYAPKGYGTLMKMSVTDSDTEVITEFYDYKRNYICPSMTRFENSLGGKVIIMGITLHGNFSHSLINYRRKRLIEDQLKWCESDVVFVNEEPDIYTIVNEAINPEKSGFKGMVTMTNLCSDELCKLSLHIPSKWQGSEFYFLEQSGDWRRAAFEFKNSDVILKEKFSYLNPVYILVK